MLSKLIILWLAAIPLMGSPGPAVLSVAAMGAAYGARRSLFYWAGIMSGTFSVLVMIATGITGIVLAVPALVTLISVLAAAYILYLAWRIATAPVIVRQEHTAPAPSFQAGYILALANPKAFAALGALFSGNTLVEGHVGADAAGKVAALSLIIVLSSGIWLTFGSVFSYVLTDPRKARIANIAFALMLVASVAASMLRG